LPEPTQTTFCTRASAPLGNAAAAELALERALLVVRQHVERDVDARHALEGADGLSDAVLEVAADRAARGRQRHHDGDGAVIRDLDRPHHAELDDVLVQLRVDDGGQGVPDRVLRRKGHASIVAKADGPP